MPLLVFQKLIFQQFHFQLSLWLNSLTKSINRKQLQNMKNFENCLDYFHQADLTELVRKTVPWREQPKKAKMDSDRASYSLLLQHAVQQLQRYQREGPKGVKDPVFIDMELISPLCDQVIGLASRECLQKAQIIKLISTFYKQSLLLTHVGSQEAVKKAIIDYSHNMESHRKAAQIQVSLLKKQLFQIKQESKEKWRTFYMIVKDNRVLRRQKGKLLRALQEQRNKICSLHRQMLQIAKQNQKNRLLLNYSQNQKALTEYLTHSQAVNKLENFIRQYPRRAKKILRSQLNRLQACENMALDDKIMYILKTAKEAEEILDEYEDLADTNERTNKLIFNISTQTDPFDIGIDSHPPQKKQSRKSNLVSLHSQTEKRRLKIDSKQWEHFSLHFHAFESNVSRRRKALKTNAREDLSVIDAVRHFKDNTIDRKVFSIKIKCKGLRKPQQFQSNIYNISLKYEPEIKDFPYLHTSYRLQMDIKRSKDISRRQYERRSSRHSQINSESVAPSQQELDSNYLLNQILPQGKLPKQENQQLNKDVNNFMKNLPLGNNQESRNLKFEGKKKSQKYMFNKSKGKPKEQAIKVDLSQGSIKHQKEIGNFNGELLQQLTSERRRSSRASINKHRESLKDLIGLYPSKLSSMASFKEQLNSFSTLNDNSTDTNLKLPIQSIKKMRKSGFAIYKKLQSLPNQVPEESSPQSKNSERKQRITNVEVSIDSRQKLKSKPFAVARKSTIKAQPTARAIPTSMAISKQRVEKKSQIFADLSNFDVLVNPPTQIRNNKAMKIINIFAPQCSRLLDKIGKLIFLRRNEISQSAPIFQQFLLTFLASHYGSRRFVIHTKFKKRGGEHSLFPIYDYLLDHTASADFLQHSFRLFARLLMFTGSNHPCIDSSRSQDVRTQLLRLHFSPAKCEQLIVCSQGSSASLSLPTVYLETIKQVKLALDNSQIYTFLVGLLPRSQRFLQFQELRQLLYLFTNDKQYLHQLINLKKLCNPDISILNLCFHAIREQWHPLLNIQDYINEELNNYNQNVNTLDSFNSQQETPQKASDLLKVQLPWLSAVIQQKIKEEGSVLFQRLVKVLHIKILIQRRIPISHYLVELQHQLIALSIKNQIDF